MREYACIGTCQIFSVAFIHLYQSVFWHDRDAFPLVNHRYVHVKSGDVFLGASSAGGSFGPNSTYKISS